MTNALILTNILIVCWSNVVTNTTTVHPEIGLARPMSCYDAGCAGCEMIHLGRDRDKTRKTVTVVVEHVTHYNVHLPTGLEGVTHRRELSRVVVRYKKRETWEEEGAE